MSIVAGFWVVSFLLIMTPGADWAYAISAGINGRRVVPAVMGLMSGHLLATLIVVAGVGVVIAQHPMALTGLDRRGGRVSPVAWHNVAASSGRPGKGQPPRGKLETVGGERALH